MNEPHRLRVGVLASGAGTNLQAILDRVHGKEADVVAVGSDKPGAEALGRALGLGIAATTGAIATPEPRDWPALVAFGVVQLAIPYALFARGVRDVQAPEAALITA